MSDTSKQKNCPKCGLPIPDGAPQGLCPKCVLLQASIPTEGGKSQPAPSLDEVAAAFPQLEILELIGQGGMGFVFKARQPKLERLVALKILSRSLADDPAFAERFTREGRVLARLNHPNIVAIHDFGQAGGFFYLLMEFVDGVNLRQAMRAGRFTPAQALAVVPKICEALQFAHNEGILHRDIKPENILVDTKGRVKIADFGIAKLLGETASGAALTGSGATLGTPHYMAPEQFEKPGTVDHRADIYSLGVVFYEMLTGELPLGRFQPPSHKVVMDVRLDEVVLHALEKEPSRRYQQASQVKTAVETIASGAPPSGAPAPDRFWKRMTVAMALLCLTLVVVVAFFARSLLVSQRNLASPQTASVLDGGTEKDSATLVIDSTTRQHSNRLPDDLQYWDFKCLMPADHQVQLVFVLWSNGVPAIKPSFSGYLKVGSRPYVAQGMMFQYYPVEAPSSAGTNVVQWNVCPGFGHTAGTWVTNQPSYRKLETAPRSVLHSGHQLAIRLAEVVEAPGATSNGWSGVEIRLILQPLESPAVQTDPNEVVNSDFVAGWGLAEASEDSMLKLIKELPCEPAPVENSLQSVKSQSVSIPVGGIEKASATLVIDTILGRQSSRESQWVFKSLIPADHQAQLIFVLWTNGAPTIRPDLSVYFKVGKNPEVVENRFASFVPVTNERHDSLLPLAHGPHEGTNLIQWNVLHVIMGYDGVRSGLISNQPAYRKLETPPQSVLNPGRQLAIRLAEFVPPATVVNSNWSGAELRVIFQPLLSPLAQTDPTEYVGTNYVAGFGLAGASEDSMLKLIKELPCEPASVGNSPP
jgi:serine/threonine protein kinase